MKFGGSILANGKAISLVADLIKRYSVGNQLVVVVSALRGVTDSLVEGAEQARKGDRRFVERLVGKLSERHLGAVADCVSPNLAEEVCARIRELLEELHQALLGVTCLGELTPRSKDLILSFGERLCAPIVAAALRSRGLEATDLAGWEAGITTDDDFGEATPLMEVTSYEVKARLLPLLKRGEIPVVAGFIGATQHGIIATLGRGGSDYTATIVGAAISADEVWIWSDVDGLMTADPKIVPNAKLIPEVSFAEAGEMAVLGAKVMHPKALEPALERGIPVRIKNAFNPDSTGTLITGKAEVRPGVVKAVTLIPDVAVVTVSGFGMIGRPGTAARVFDLLGKNRINILMISQSVSEANISFVVKRDVAQQAISVLEASLLGTGVIREVELEDDVCVVAAVGAGMRGMPGIAARVFRAVAKRDVNIRMIAQGSSELNISFVVKEEDAEEAVRAIHEEFGLGKN